MAVRSWWRERKEAVPCAGGEGEVAIVVCMRMRKRRSHDCGGGGDAQVRRCSEAAHKSGYSAKEDWSRSPERDSKLVSSNPRTQKETLD
ncbi:hypothetical protein VNO80_09963 [Phaseolus coccineus]|uniref:Uncharacterized protein n=1 Tax=Phaseolus coccineus TaxID=3886 RepID=A0AAN9NDM4_PHACN